MFYLQSKGGLKGDSYVEWWQWPCGESTDIANYGPAWHVFGSGVRMEMNRIYVESDSDITFYYILIWMSTDLDIFEYEYKTCILD
jgi:hypothetical protein